VAVPIDRFETMLARGRSYRRRIDELPNWPDHRGTPARSPSLATDREHFPPAQGERDSTPRGASAPLYASSGSKGLSRRARRPVPTESMRLDHGQESELPAPRRRTRDDDAEA